MHIQANIQNLASGTSGSSRTRHPVAIVGARGYAGLDLARLLLAHPEAELKACYSADAKFSLGDYLTETAATQVPTLPMDTITETARGMTVFLATPAEASIELATKLNAAGIDVVDLSAAFRLESEADYRAWYALDHHAGAALLAKAEYGLVPWIGPAKAPATGARLVANPGCYATAVLTGLLPLLSSDLIQVESLVIDAKSGTSGAGRKAAENLLFNEVDGECLPYRVGKHQHLPEIRRHAYLLTGKAIDPMFTTHLLPVRRGIIAGIYARVRAGVTASDVQQAYQAAYGNYPLVRFAEGEKLLSLRKVVGSARTHIGYRLEGDKLYAFSLIDNLLKGAASQAVENFNRMRDLPVHLGLIEREGVL